jgi:Na+-driven multidrug efflux pump
VLGVTQSVASLARAVGPSISAALIYSAIQTLGRDNQLHNMSDHTLLVTFWTAAGIMFAAFLLAAYFTRLYAKDFSKAEVAPASG